MPDFLCEALRYAVPLAAPQVPFPGSLHITSRRLCFVFEEPGVAPIKLPGSALQGVAKLAAAKGA